MVPSCFPAAMAFCIALEHFVGVYLLKYVCRCWLLLNYTAGALRYKGILSNFQANTILMKVIIQGFSLPHLLFTSGLLL